MNKFDKYVEKMHEDRDKLFEIEYEVNNFHEDVHCQES